MNAGSAGVWRKLRRRKLVQWALTYLASAWAVLEVLDLVDRQSGWRAMQSMAVGGRLRVLASATTKATAR